MKNGEVVPYVLGLDIGANSVGWAVLELDAKQTPCRILDSGSRIFEEAVKVDPKEGKEKSKNMQRREARLSRRRTRRRGAAQGTLFDLLQGAKLLPLEIKNRKGQVVTQRGPLLCALNDLLVRRWQDKLCPSRDLQYERRQIAQMLPYILRAKAVSERLEPEEVGRALYHLGQRRGFKSNRKSAPKADEKPGEVKATIDGLDRKLQQSGLMLGQYLSQLNPEEARIRGEGQYTSRKMYDDEFKAIWSQQCKDHPPLNDVKFRGRIRRAIFHQEPVRSQRDLIGRCELEKNRRRAPRASLLSQTFRLYARVNNLEKVFKGYRTVLSPEDRDKIVQFLETREKATYAGLRKMLGWERGSRFNVEGIDDEEADVRGNTTASRLIEVFGVDGWENLGEIDRDNVVLNVLGMSNESALTRRGKIPWKLSDEQASKFGGVKLESGYMHYSAQAMKKLLALLKEEKLRENEAIGQVYERKPLSPMDQLPPVLKVLPQMTNPLVRRALSEVRHVVNHLLSERGKPTLVRIELARQLKKSKEEREEEWKKNRSNESNRRTAAKYLLDQRDIRNPSPSLIRKVLLAFECDWHCPYSIEGFNVDDLLSEPPKVQVDHIIPRSRHPEDSFFNQTLCMTWVNQKKGNRTPFEAFGPHVPQDQRGRIRPWNEIEAAVRRFPGASGKIKLERFRMETLESLDDYAARQLNDTAYATKEAKKFLGLLYGGESATRVTAGKGQLTAILRGHWGLKKSRDDHRHHAVDAVVTALQDAAWVKEITDACQRAARLGKDNIDRIPEPWVSFRDDVAASVEKIVVSHRVRRKVQGPLHEETNYRQPKMEAKSKPLAHIRKPLSDLSADQVKLIVDEKVRNLVENKLIELQQKNPKRAFRFAGDHPFFVSRKKRRIPIHRVRIAVSLRTQEIGKDDHLRHVKLGENHHIEIIKGPDEKWEGRLVTRLEAMRRAKEGEVVICKEAKEGGTFVFSLAQGEIIEIDEPGVGRGLWRIRTITRDKDKQGKDKPRILAVRLNDARQKEKIPSTDMRRPFVGGLCVLNCRKVVIDVLGNVRDAND